VKMLSVLLILASKWIFFIVMAGSIENVKSPSVAYVPQSWFSGAFIESMFAALLASFWAFEGWNVTGFIGGEIKNPTRNLPLAIVAGVLFVIVIYTTVNLTYLYVLPIDEIIALQSSENSIAAVAVVGRLLGEPGAMFIAVLIVITT